MKRNKRHIMKESIIILAGGGPAPGINTVEGTIAKAFMAEGYRVLGLHGGYSGLFSASPNFIEFNFALADSIFNRHQPHRPPCRPDPS